MTRSADMTFTLAETGQASPATKPGSTIDYGNFGLGGSSAPGDYASFLSGASTPAAPSAAASGMSDAQKTQLLTAGIAGAASITGQVLTSLSASADRDAQMRLRQLQFDLARGAQDMQRAQMEGNQELQLQLARLQNERLLAAAQTTGSLGATDASAALIQLQQQNAALAAQLQAAQTTPTWVWVLAGVAGIAVVGGIAYYLVNNNSTANAREDEEQELLRRRDQIRAELAALNDEG